MTETPVEMPTRQGQRPTTSNNLPHRQVDQIAPAEVQEELWRRMSALADVETGPSRVSVPGARAVFLSAKCCDGLENGVPFGGAMIDREFAHIHPPKDGSLHATLPADIRERAIDTGWAEPHILAGTDPVPETVVMLYGPRDREELEVIWSLIEASHTFALGAVAG